MIEEFGRGFSVSNLQFIRRFYQEYPIQQTLSVKLSWSHYCELLSISDQNKRSFYEKETVNSRWSVRELKRQINTSLFERILLSEGKANKETVLALSKKGIDILKAEDILKDPYVLIELKTSKLMPEAVGQLNMYLNYYQAEVNDEIDNAPIGIILCTDKDNVDVFII